MRPMRPLASLLGRAFVPLALCFLGAVAADASAQSKDPTTEARELAREGWKALDAQNFKEALDKVTRAEALYHAPTHLLLMGNAQAGLGKLADALGTFEKLAAEPLTAAAPDAFKEAQAAGRKRMKELLARVPSMLVVVESAEATAPIVKVDGQKQGFESGLAVRFDPGEHEITVEAEGFVTVKQRVTLPEKGGVVRVPITLQKVGAPATSGSASATGSATGGPSASVTAEPGAQGPNRVPAYIAFGVAGASVIVGAITGGVSLSMTSDLKARCPNDECKRSDQGDLDTANALANASTATFVIGGVAAAAGVVLFAVDLGGKSKRGGASGGRIEPWISAGGGGLRGRF